MKKYEYKFVEVKMHPGIRLKANETFAECKEIIISEAEKGWRFKQVVLPITVTPTFDGAPTYEIIFEREV